MILITFSYEGVGEGSDEQVQGGCQAGGVGQGVLVGLLDGGG